MGSIIALSLLMDARKNIFYKSVRFCLLPRLLSRSTKFTDLRETFL